MNGERKKLYLYAGVNFLIGITVGIVLFYGQMKHDSSIFGAEYSYDSTVEIIDFFRVWWLNTMWLFSAFLAQAFLRVATIHIIVAVRGCASSYGSMYLINYIGIREAVISVLPQCISILPLLIWYSVNCGMKRISNENEGVFMKRGDGVRIFLLSMFSAGIETLCFMFLCRYLL